MPEATRLTGHEFPIEKVFSNDFAFRIPPYQRPYAWTTEQAGELFDDLLTAYKNDKLTPKEADPYFLGSLVVVKGTPAESEVIDGQQRLTTLTILLAAARCLVPEDDAKDIDVYISEKGSRITRIPDRPRLKLRPRDQEFFEKYIQRPLPLTDTTALLASVARIVKGESQVLDHPLLKIEAVTLTDSKRNIRDNLECLLRLLAKLPTEDRLGLVRFTITKCFVVVVATPSLKAAYRIFAVLNDRGLDLTHADILKADVLGRIGADREDDYTKKWEDKEDEIGRQTFSDLFAHIRMIYARAKLKKTVLEEFREVVAPKEPDAAKLVDEVIIPHADSLDDIVKRTYTSARHQDKINGYLAWLARIDNADWLPPTILYMTKHRNSPEEMLAFLQDLERLTSSMFIRRFNVNDRIDRYGRLLAAIDDKKDLSAPDSPLQLAADEMTSTMLKLGESIYESTKTRLYVTLRLDSFLSSGGVEYDHAIITLEHVLPQTVTPASEWARTWPDEALRNLWVHRLGNLLLLTQRKNSEAQNYDFGVKKTKYFTSPKGVCTFALTSQVLSESQWLPATVERRQKDLLAALKTGWRL
jgi:hypothetical protein